MGKTDALPLQPQVLGHFLAYFSHKQSPFILKYKYFSNHAIDLIGLIQVGDIAMILSSQLLSDQAWIPDINFVISKLHNFHQPTGTSLAFF